MRRLLTAAAGAIAAALLIPGAVVAAPPDNDNRAAAQVIPDFPATIDGTTAEATVERLDPQVSKCGRIEGTLWYRIDQAPDGTVSLGLQGAGLAPVVRVYSLTKNALKELGCAAATAGAPAQVSFETSRGASYLVVVGRRPSTPDAAFELTARLFLPPANDSPGEATKLGLPTTINGSTIGATTDSDDPNGCGLAGGTVWYRLSPGAAKRLVVRLHVTGEADMSLVVLEKVRSEANDIGCGRTNTRGDLTVAWDVQEGATYLLAIGQRKGSPPGDFTLQASSAQARETAPGGALRGGHAASTVNWLSDVNDVYWRRLSAGTTYSVAFSSTGGCARLGIFGRQVHGQRPLLRTISCGGYAELTPGPQDGGRFVFEVTAPPNTGTVSYRLVTRTAGPDDLGMGVELPNLATRHGRLSPAAADVVDLYHFDVAQPSDVRLRLGSKTGGVSLALLRDDGSRLGSSSDEIQRNLPRGRYVVAVRATVGQPGGTYSVSLVIRQLTTTTVRLSATEISPGSSVALSVFAPPATEGTIELQIDRFDPLTGWHFSRLLRIPAPGGRISWTPPALGRWRASASYAGTLRFSPSRTGYVYLLVAPPIH